MIPESLRKRLFSHDPVEPDGATREQCNRELGKFGLNTQPVTPSRMVDAVLPDRMRDLPRFFNDISTEQLTPYQGFIEQVKHMEGSGGF